MGLDRSPGRTRRRCQAAREAAGSRDDPRQRRLGVVPNVIAAPSAWPIRLVAALLSAFLLALALTARPAGAQSERCGATDPEVGWLRFHGNVSFDDEELGNAIVTTPSSWARRVFRFVGTRRCLDGDEFARDRVRLEIFYRKHGYRQ